LVKYNKTQARVEGISGWLEKHIISVKTDLAKPFGKAFMLEALKKREE